MRKIALIVPCHQESQRFAPEGFAELAALPDVTLLLVNDGSTDATERVLQRFAARGDVDAQVLSFDRSRGKAAAVRDGLLAALETGAEIVGYVDADLATPPGEVRRLLHELQERRCAAVLGSRVQVLGAAIERSLLRHYGGRIFATWFSLLLRVPVYDTQCGAKFFRRSAALEAALAEPFVSRWCFDVELLGRLLIGTPEVAPLAEAELQEVPLRVWRDVPGSKFRGVAATPLVIWETLRITRDLTARRRKLARRRG